MQLRIIEKNLIRLFMKVVFVVKYFFAITEFYFTDTKYKS